MRGLNFPVTSISVALYLPCWLLWSSFSKLSLKWICFHRINFQPIVTQTSLFSWEIKLKKYINLRWNFAEAMWIFIAGKFWQLIMLRKCEKFRKSWTSCWKTSKFLLQQASIHIPLQFKLFQKGLDARICLNPTIFYDSLKSNRSDESQEKMR